MKTSCLLISLVVGILFSVNAISQTGTKNRVIILTDIENEPDDTQSMIRLLLYSNNIDIKGIVATTSVHLKTQVHPESIRKIIETYGKLQPNLVKHEAGFPSAETLLSKVKQGLPVYGMSAVGEDKDSEGSDWIIKILEEDDERPLWVSVWGGANTLAQALYKINKTKSPAEAKRLIAKLRVYTISDQDDSGIWMRKTFPDLFYIVSPGGYGGATWIAITSFSKDLNNETISNKWLAENIQQGHGPLGALYPDVAYGMEGDTPSWLSLITNGLSVSEHPEWGGWGGRYELYKPDYDKMDKGFTGGVPVEAEPRAIWTNAVDSYSPYIFSAYGKSVRMDSVVITDNKATIWRWRDDFQNDFAARIDWCTKSFEEANHPPVPALAHPEELTVKSGDVFVLNASGSSDPDGDNLSFLWFNYPEAGSYKKMIKISNAENIYKVNVQAPLVDRKETAHFILKVTDKGIPQLSRYKRVIVNIIPNR